jgi:hypothetical protein
MNNLPFDSFCRNQAWTAVTLIAGALVAWLQVIGFTGDLAKAEPKTLRHHIFSVAATIAHRGHDLIIRLDRTWPWTPDILRAYGRIRAAFP